jgi:hypothetical protein
LLLSVFLFHPAKPFLIEFNQIMMYPITFAMKFHRSEVLVKAQYDPILAKMAGFYLQEGAKRI